MLSTTAKDSGTLLLGIIITSVGGFLITLALTRSLAPADFGLFVTALIFSQMVAEMFEFGIRPAVLNFVSSNQGETKLKFMKITFIISLVLALAVSLTTLFASPFLAAFIFKNSYMAVYIKYASIGIFLLMLLYWGQANFQAHRLFLNSVVTTSSINVLRLISILALLLLGIKQPDKLFLIFQSIIILSLIFVLLNQKTNFLFTKITRKMFNKVIVFTLPVGFGYMLLAIYSRLDQIMVFNITGKLQAGFYGLSFQLSNFLLFTSIALTSAAIPRFTSLNNKDFKTYFIKILSASFLLVLLSLISIPLSYFIIPVIFGKNFLPSVAPFQILVIGVVFYILSAPFLMAILYRFKKSKFISLIYLLSLILIFFLLSYLIPLSGITGAAISVALVYLIQLLISVGYFFKLATKDGYFNK